MKKWIKWLMMIVGIIGIIMVLGVKDYMDQQAEIRREMVRIAKSEEAEAIYRQEIESLDPKAFTAEGIIQSYEVNYESLDTNPMGGFSLEIIINSDTDLTIRIGLEKDVESNRLDIYRITTSHSLNLLLEGN